MNELVRLTLAEIRQTTGKAYPHLEARLAALSVPELRDLLRLVRDVRDGENSRMQGRLQRMGIPRGVVR